MTDAQLGRIEEVDLRQVWPHEANDFTPWLAEHLDLLGEALHLDLKLVDAETGVGRFVADIVAAADDATVVIENQLERTDHSHLGQLVTYAAGLDARILIWITPRFSNEHREALGWLNRWTPTDVQVYGVEARAIRIDDSIPAPEFKPVVVPDGWSARAGIRRQAAREVSGDTARRNDFFQALIDEARQRGLTNKVTTEVVQYQSFVCPVTRKGINYFAELRPGGGVLVNLQIATRDASLNDRIIKALGESRQEIEAELGFEPEWITPNGRTRAFISISSDGSIDDPEERQAEVRTWLLDTLTAMKSALDPRLQQIVAELDVE